MKMKGKIIRGRNKNVYSNYSSGKLQVTSEAITLQKQPRKEFISFNQITQDPVSETSSDYETLEIKKRGTTAEQKNYLNLNAYPMGIRALMNSTVDPKPMLFSNVLISKRVSHEHLKTEELTQMIHQLPKRSNQKRNFLRERIYFASQEKQEIYKQDTISMRGTKIEFFPPPRHIVY